MQHESAQPQAGGYRPSTPPGDANPTPTRRLRVRGLRVDHRSVEKAGSFTEDRQINGHSISPRIPKIILRKLGISCLDVDAHRSYRIPIVHFAQPRSRLVSTGVYIGYVAASCTLNICYLYDTRPNIYDGVYARIEIQVLRWGKSIVLRTRSDEGESAVRLEGNVCKCVVSLFARTPLLLRSFVICRLSVDNDECKYQR